MVRSDMGNQEQYTDAEIAALPPIIGIEQAARVLGCCGRTITRMCEGGVLKHCKAGNRYRINRDSLLAYAGLDVKQDDAALKEIMIG